MILKGLNIYDMTMNWAKFGCNASSATRTIATGLDDHQMSTRNDIHILIGGYKEMPFSETRDYPYAYVNRKRTINAIHIFNMDDISVNPNRE